MSCHQTIQMPLDLGREIVVDLFAGGGGASCGIEQGIGRPVDVAINHDPLAVAMHEINHPNTRHFCESVFKVSPIDATGNLPVGLLWLSPDCTHHSKAKGGKPVSNKRRGLAWVGVKWARRCRPRVIMAENVEEFADWGPLTEQGRPCQVRKGQTFRQWVQQLERLGYEVQHRVLRACDHGAPTIRKRLFVIARRDGRPGHQRRQAAAGQDRDAPACRTADRTRPRLDRRLCRRCAWPPARTPRTRRATEAASRASSSALVCSPKRCDDLCSHGAARARRSCREAWSRVAHSHMHFERCSVINEAGLDRAGPSAASVRFVGVFFTSFEVHVRPVDPHRQA